MRDLSLQKQSKVVEGHLMPDHVHMLLSIPPKYSVAQIVDYIRDKSALNIARTFSGREYIKIQETQGLRLDQPAQPRNSRPDSYVSHHITI